jgi:hypothetical protein
MSKQNLSPAAVRVEELLDSPRDNSLKEFLKGETLPHVEAKGGSPSAYDIFAIRRNANEEEIFGPYKLNIGHYSDEELYGVSGSPLQKFRFSIKAAANNAKTASELDDDDVGYAHSVTLFWANLAQLTGFIGQSPGITEIVAELRTARFQFLRKDTPKTFITAISKALRELSEAKAFDSIAVDRFVEQLSQAGFDSLAQDGIRDTSE